MPGNGAPRKRRSSVSVPNKILKALHERADSRPLFVVIEEGLRANDIVHHLERTNPEAVAQARRAVAA
jgi:hypothetical protein